MKLLMLLIFFLDWKFKLVVGGLVNVLWLGVVIVVIVVSKDLIVRVLDREVEVLDKVEEKMGNGKEDSGC